jgi:hypothetical protein
VLQTLDQLRFCIFGGKRGDLLQPPDMLFLVFLQFGAFDIDKLDLAIEVVFYRFVFLDLFVQVNVFLIDRLLFLPNAVFCVVDLLISLKNLLVVRRLKLYCFFLCLQLFFFS